MPLYEFFCNTCKHRFTRWVQLDERGVPTTPLPQCPKCLDYDVDREISYPARVEVK